MYRFTLTIFLSILIFISGCADETQPQDISDVKPEDNRFTTSILTEPNVLDEPMAFDFINDEEMLIVERKGGVKSLNVKTRELRKVADIPVNIIYTNKEGQTRAAEEGLMGVTVHPNYAENNWIYMFYADPDEPKHVLARFEYRNGRLNSASKRVVLEFPAQREVCCHTGGGMAWDDNNNLYLTTGNNTANPPSGTSNLDERPGFESSDDQRTAGNTNDLRGKILRIHPEADGSYTIPAGNLFPPGTEKTRPEIYTMGHRNPWRLSIDSKTGYIYWGEVGPDASEETPRGPRGYDEFNQAKGPGFFGWPYFIGDNIPYNDFDHENDEVGGPFDVENPQNTSRNNTGLTELPTPVPAMIWYPYSQSDEFPLLGSAGRSATGGPVFRQADFAPSDKRFPAYYEGKWLIVEFMRGWIMAVTMDENGDFVSMERFLPEEDFISAIDMKFSPDGDLYVLEYGSAWFQGNDNALVKRVRYNGGNRAPVVQANADKVAGAVPLQVRLSSEGSMDYDEEDSLTYSWSVTSSNGFSARFTEPNPEVTLEEPGTYVALLKVSDEHGGSNQRAFHITAGNEPPEVNIDITSGNQSFFFPGNRIAYDITVSDKEDGSVENGTIDPESVAINFDYTPEGFDLIAIAQNHRSTDNWINFSRGESLIEGSDCFSCHKIEEESIGPSYLQVAAKYENTEENKSMLASRIINGSVGNWGEHAMSAHPNFSDEEAKLMVDYILKLTENPEGTASYPMSGTLVTRVPEGENGKGGYLLRAAYTDNGSGGLQALADEDIIALRNPVILPESYDTEKGTVFLSTPRRTFNMNEDGAYIGFNNIDLTGIGGIQIKAEASGQVNAAGGVIEVRIDGPEGELLGSTEKIEIVEIDFRAEMQRIIGEWEQGGRKGPRPGWGEVREMLTPKYIIPVNNTDGVHDIYFRVINPDAKDGQVLLQLNEIEFLAD